MQKKIKFGSSKKSIILSIKKNKLIKQTKKINIGNSLLIFKIIESGILDSSIKKIGGVPIYSNNKPVLKKDYVDSYNHYVYVLDNFIHYFYDNFNYNIDSEYEIIAACLKNNSDILLCNKYVFDNDNIKYYRREYDKIIVSNFYYNICTFKEELNEYFEDFSVKVDKLNIDDANDIEKLLNILKVIYLYNNDKHVVLSLFNKVTMDTYKFYLDGFEFMFYSYFNMRKSKNGSLSNNG